MRAHPNGRGSPYQLADTGNGPPRPAPPQDWQIISLCHEVSPCVQVISFKAALSETAAPQNFYAAKIKVQDLSHYILYFFSP